MCITYILACNLCRLPNVKAEADNCLQVTNGRLAPSEFHNYIECPVATPTTAIPVKCQTAAIMTPMLKANSLAQDCWRVICQALPAWGPAGGFGHVGLERCLVDEGQSF